MKKFLAFAAIAATLFTTACKDSSDDPTPTGASVNSRTTLVLGAQLNANESYISLEDGVRYKGDGGSSSSAKASDNGDKVDLTYAFLTAGPTLTSYAARNTGTGLTGTIPANANKTYFKASSLTRTQFDAITKDNDANFSTISVATTNPQSIVVENGKCYEVLRNNGKRALIFITNVSTGTGGFVQFDSKSQK